MKKIKLIFFAFAGFFWLSWGWAQQKEVALTVYNDNLALVKEVRTLTLPEGVTQIKFQDVAAQIDPTSVYFKSLTAPEKVTILEQNYEYDLVNSIKILQKYIDQKINLEGKEGKRYTGTLLNASGKDVILRTEDGGIKILNRQSILNMEFPRLPEGLITRPTLVWTLDSQQAGKHEVEVGYLTSGIQWHAEYVGIANEADTQLDLSAWVSLDNKSGATYKEAQLKLVAGEIHRAREIVPKYREAQAEYFSVAKKVQFKEKAFFEYHLYTLQRKATVANNQIKQISLFEPVEVAVKKIYSYDGAQDDNRVRVNLEFKNEKKVGLGMPLPKGKIRLYKRDTDGSLVFIGEDFIQHTPKDEEVKVYAGNAFDIVGKRVQKDRRSIGKNSWEEKWEITLRNHKAKAVEVHVIEHLQPDWEIIRSSHTYEKKDAFTIEFKVQVPRDGEEKIHYVVRYQR